MTNERACANREDLFKYLDDCQRIATDLSSLIETASVLDNEGVHAGGVTTILKVMAEMADTLENRLDSVNLRKVTS